MSRFALSTARVLAGLSTLVPFAAAAQTNSFGSGTVVGLSIQAIATRGGTAEIPALGLHVTSIMPSGFGMDFTVATLPTAAMEGLLLLAPDLGLARVIPIAGGAVMIKAGMSAVLVGAGNGLGGVLGGHVGAAAFVRLGPRAGMRLEVVPRFYTYEGHAFPVTTFGIGLTSLPARRR